MTLLASPVVNRVLMGDNLELMRAEPDGSVQMAYLDPPFNTGRAQTRRTLATTAAADGAGHRAGVGGRGGARARGGAVAAVGGPAATRRNCSRSRPTGTRSTTTSASSSRACARC